MKEKLENFHKLGTKLVAQGIYVMPYEAKDTTVAAGLPPNHAVTAEWNVFKTTQPEEYWLAAGQPWSPGNVEGILFDMFLRGWVAAGGKVG